MKYIAPLAFLMACLALAGCDNTVATQEVVTPEEMPKPSEDDPTLITESETQEVYEVPHGKMKAFLLRNKSQRITSINSVNMAGDGRTSSFIVVLEKAP